MIGEAGIWGLLSPCKRGDRRSCFSVGPVGWAQSCPSLWVDNGMPRLPVGEVVSGQTNRRSALPRQTRDLPTVKRWDCMPGCLIGPPEPSSHPLPSLDLSSHFIP